MVTLYSPTRFARRGITSVHFEVPKTYIKWRAENLACRVLLLTICLLHSWSRRNTIFTIKIHILLQRSPLRYKKWSRHMFRPEPGLLNKQTNVKIFYSAIHFVDCATTFLIGCTFLMRSKSFVRRKKSLLDSLNKSFKQSIQYFE